MHEKCDFNEKGRVFRSYLHLRTKTLEDLRRKMTRKSWIGSVEREKDEKKKKLFEIVKNS